MTRALSGLDGIVAKAEAHADEHGIEHSALLNARLFPDMHAFTRQIQIASDTAKSGVARISGVEVPSWEDDETSFADLRARIAKTVDYLAGFEPQDLEGSDKREVEIVFPGGSIKMDGKSHLLDLVLPNLYFHVTTAYNILRHNGVAIGKRDFLSAPGS